MKCYITDDEIVIPTQIRYSLQLYLLAAIRFTIINTEHFLLMSRPRKWCLEYKAAL